MAAQCHSQRRSKCLQRRGCVHSRCLIVRLRFRRHGRVSSSPPRHSYANRRAARSILIYKRKHIQVLAYSAFGRMHAQYNVLLNILTPTGVCEIQPHQKSTLRKCRALLRQFHIITYDQYKYMRHVFFVCVCACICVCMCVCVCVCLCMCVCVCVCVCGVSVSVRACDTCM